MSQASWTWPGKTKGSCAQPMFSRVALISSAPSGAPWQSWLPDRFGDPQPITVLQQIRLGLSVTDRAAFVALSDRRGVVAVDATDHVQP